jgi:hypothetical protein
MDAMSMQWYCPLLNLMRNRRTSAQSCGKEEGRSRNQNKKGEGREEWELEVAIILALAVTNPRGGRKGL